MSATLPSFHLNRNIPHSAPASAAAGAVPASPFQYFEQKNVSASSSSSSSGRQSAMGEMREAPACTEIMHHMAKTPLTHTSSPVVTGSSVLAIKYKDGVMLISDTAGNYGSLSMFKQFSRLREVNQYTLIGGGGEISDFQHIIKLLNELRIDDFVQDDGHVLQPKEIHSYLGRIMYQKRSKVDPLWNSIITAGFYDGQSFLGTTDLYGSVYTGDLFATGMGNHLAIPLLRKHHRLDMSYDEARKLLEDCMRVLFYRHTLALNSLQVATVTKDGIKVTEPFSLDTFWGNKRQVNPFNTE